MRKPSSVRVASRVPMPGAPQRPQRHGGAAHAGGRQQPRRGRAAERHLRALAEPEALARAAADHPEEGDVAGEGEQLEDGAADDPARVGVEGAAQRVGEGVQRASGDDDRGRGGGGQRGGHGGAASERAHVEGRDEDVGVGLAEGHGVVVAAPPPCVSLRFYVAAPGADACTSVRLTEEYPGGPDTRQRCYPPKAGYGEPHPRTYQHRALWAPGRMDRGPLIASERQG